MNGPASTVNDVLAIRQLTPRGVLRAALNLSNAVLVSRQGETGDLSGVAPDLVRWISNRLSVPCICVPFASPLDLISAVDDDVWDICLMAAASERTASIVFSRPYAEIDATYLVRDDSPLKAVADIDRPRVRVGAVEGSAYALWLSRHLAHGEFVEFKSQDYAAQAFHAREIDALAGLRANLDELASRTLGTRVVDGRFMAVAQSIGTHRSNVEGSALLWAVLEDAILSGFVASAFSQHGIAGVTVTSSSTR
ncbi:transporter substrate-binding domain-containing protein [Burkholderia cenocepacia]|uniref:transporter substrate-binding domain-containing protein n=1 Tax=Burkholderia cenocepacia TaxID=95486 RepID=UPI00285BDDEC|nr:transporter substrate-binding domain-containing protein [Burkholderia cenocepacia]MDR5645476.1 transporter substrate-binding domain-containing protein [Burkholderia cenocepacia]